jgi:hypothetical protein
VHGALEARDRAVFGTFSHAQNVVLDAICNEAGMLLPRRRRDSA